MKTIESPLGRMAENQTLKRMAVMQPYNKQDVNGVPVNALPAEDLEYTANKMIMSKPTTKLMGRNKMLFRNILTDMKNGGKKRSIRQKRVVENIKGEPVLLGDHIAKQGYAKLKPLKKVMQMALESVGVKPGKTIDIVAEQFYNNIIRPSKKTGIADFKFDYPEINTGHMTYDQADNAKDVITESILKFIRVARRKEASGSKLTKVEQILADGSKIVEKNIESTAKQEAAQQLGQNILFNKKTQLIIVGAIVGIVLLVLAFRK
jgi:hypothetical protein